MAAASFVFTAFISAFLLFQVQPFMGKALLPWFGGTPLVWTTCMMFFQALLLAGYAYAHLIITRAKPLAQWLIHLVVLAAGMALMRLLPDSAFAPTGGEQPALLLITILAVHVGAPFFALSATAPLVQAWFRGRFPTRSPYPLYAVSNAGSLAGVLSYPFVFEPLLSLPVQETVWRIGYLLFACGLGLSGFLFWRARKQSNSVTPMAAAQTDEPPDQSPESPTKASAWMWLALSACGSVLLLATTDQISQDVAASPLFWVVPLCLYLLSFIFCFADKALYHRSVWLNLLPVAVTGIGIQIFWGGAWPVGVQIAVYGASLFIGCMVCHGELARLKPGPRDLSRYYLAVSVGGVIGGVFVAVVAPFLFPDMWEYPLGWIALYSLVLKQQYREAGFTFFQGSSRLFWIAFGAGWLVMAIVFVADVIFDHREAYVTTRGFFGRVAVYRNPQKRCLYHGRIRHGCQWNDPEMAMAPTTYYGPDTGINVAFRLYREPQKGPLNIGVIGLGVGTAAIFGEPGDTLKFFELDEAVYRIAKEHFSYLNKSQAKTDVIIGDGRLTLEKEREQNTPRYDILVVDAFAGDAVPLHLLTKEAFDLYWDRIKPGGVLVANISNRHVRLESLMLGLAKDRGTKVFLFEGKSDWQQLLYGSTWIVMTDNQAIEQEIKREDIEKPWPKSRRTPILFTDQYSNLLALF